LSGSPPGFPLLFGVNVWGEISSEGCGYSNMAKQGAKKAKRSEQTANEGGTNETGAEQTTWRTGDGRFAGDLPAQQRRLLYPAGCREHLRKALAKEFEEIAAGFVKAAKSGSVPHVKLATELLKPTRQGTTRKKSTAARILKEWAEEKRRQATKDSAPE
jgi:hypothetical protein